MKKLLIVTSFVIAVTFAITGWVLYFRNTADTNTQESVHAEEPTPTPVPIPTMTVAPAETPTINQTEQTNQTANQANQINDDTTAKTQTELNNVQTEKKDEYNGWPAIPESQLPQPDKKETNVVIPSQNQYVNYNGNYVVVTPESHTSTNRTSLDYLAESVFLLTNREREAKGVPSLSYAYDLQDAADTRAKEASMQFSHTRPNGESCHQIITKDCHVTGENLIMADKLIASAENMVAEWMNSEGHRYNIMLKDFKEMAVGVYEVNGAVYVCQLFCG